jgi:hypothetical protein
LFFGINKPLLWGNLILELFCTLLIIFCPNAL